MITKWQAVYQGLDITSSLAASLIATQFLEWAHLPIQPVTHQGHDNRTFRLGTTMLIRLPTAKAYALKVPKEQELLPKLQPHLTIPIPLPLKMGKPCAEYPFNFSIYQWREGESANTIKIEEEKLTPLAVDLARFLKDLQRINPHGGPPPGLHNWYRGAPVSVYDTEARRHIVQLRNTRDREGAFAVWEAALKSRWEKAPVWIHGDFAPGNILIKEDRLAAVIDFGGLGVGDPACDLVIAWTFLKTQSRQVFKEQINLDPDTWARARGWALWKATLELATLADKTTPAAQKHQQIIQDVIEEHFLGGC